MLQRMAVEVHAVGRIELGRFAEFIAAAERWRDAVPEERQTAGLCKPSPAR
jgi:hypothetical protein